VNDVTVKFSKLSVEKWSPQLQLKTNKEVMQPRTIKINKWLFQGDWLSPLLFCLALISLTHELNGSNYGYQVYGTEKHVQKLISRRAEELRN